MKKLLTLVLSLMLAVSAAPTAVFAETETDLSQATIEIENATYIFNGKAHEPGVTVSLGTRTLKEGEDYTVSYVNNVKASTATTPNKIVITGMGAYSGTAEKIFTIEPAKMSGVKVVFSQDTYPATGQPVQPAFTATLGDYTLEDGADYSATFSNNTAAGKATVTLRSKNGNFEGTTTAEFTIVSKDISELEARVLTTEYDYDGTAKEPAVEIKDGEATLAQNTDYTLTYEDNINAGTARVIVTGMGKYGGTKTLEFRIKGRPNRIVTGADSYTKYMTSKEFSLDAEAAEAKQLIYTSSNEDVVTVSDTGRVTVKGTGAATITIKTSGTTGFEPAEKVVTVTVKPLKPVVTLTSPEKKQVKVTWTKQKGATRYQVRYGRQGKYYYRTCKHIDSQFSKTYTYLNNRTSGKTYYIKVRSITEMPDGTVVYGNWSEVQKIKSK